MALNPRLDALTSWHADWSGLRVAVLGLGATGFSVADTLAELGAEVLVLAEDAAEEYARLIPVIGARAHVGPLDEVLGALRVFGPDLVVASPGFSPQHPLIRWVREESDAALWGDVELAWRVRDKVSGSDGEPAPWVLVTGARGSSSVTGLVAKMVAEAGLRPAPSGDNGVPVLDAMRDPAGFDAHILGLSVRRLWSLTLSRPAGQPVPHASVCADAATSSELHLSSQAVVYRNTRVACVYNKSDAATRLMVEEADVVDGARAIGFDLGVPGPSDLGVVDGILVDRAFHDDRHRSALELATIDELREAGLATAALAQDVLIAAALARSLRVPAEAVHDALRRAG